MSAAPTQDLAAEIVGTMSATPTQRSGPNTGTVCGAPAQILAVVIDGTVSVAPT